MSTLLELYEERDRLRGKARALDAERELLVEPLAVNRRAINAMLQALPRASTGDPGLYAPLRTTQEDLPEFFFERAE